METLKFLTNFLNRDRLNARQFYAIFLVAIGMLLLAACSDDDLTGGGNNDNGEPYKFRVEVTTQYPDSCKVAVCLGSYNYTDKNGLPRTEWITDPDVAPDEIAVESPLIKEYEIPRYFSKFYINVSNFTKTREAMLNDTNRQTTCTLKIFVNDELIVSATDLFGVGWGVVYDSNKKKYIYNDSNGNTVETSSL